MFTKVLNYGTHIKFLLSQNFYTFVTPKITMFIYKKKFL